MWIVRSIDGRLHLCENKPTVDRRSATVKFNGNFFEIDYRYYPEVTYANSPREIELNLI